MIYLQILVSGTSVKGASTALGYEGQIVIDSFDWKLNAKHVVDDDRGYLVRTEMSAKHITLNKVFDMSTPTLCRYMNARTRFSRATITMLSMTMSDDRDQPLKMMEMVLKDGFIEDLGIHATESGKAIALKEKLSLSYDECQLVYYPVNAASMTRSSKASQFLLQTASRKS